MGYVLKERGRNREPWHKSVAHFDEAIDLSRVLLSVSAYLPCHWQLQRPLRLSRIRRKLSNLWIVILGFASHSHTVKSRGVWY